MLGQPVEVHEGYVIALLADTEEALAQKEAKLRSDEKRFDCFWKLAEISSSEDEHGFNWYRVALLKLYID